MEVCVILFMFTASLFIDVLSIPDEDIMSTDFTDDDRPDQMECSWKSETSREVFDVHCYREICNCSGTSVNCEHGNLTYIPNFWNNITQVDLTYNKLHVIKRETFVNLTRLHVKSLSLAWNNIINITADAFAEFSSLIYLDLSGNGLLKPQFLANTFRGLEKSNIRSLNLSSMKLQNVSMNMFYRLKNTNLEYLTLDYNQLGEYNQKSFGFLRRVRNISVQNNEIRNVKWELAPRLVTLYLHYNLIQTVPSFCSLTNTSFFPRLEELVLSHNYIIKTNRSLFRCLPKLKVLNLDDNPLTVLETNVFSELPNLEQIYLQNLKYSTMKINKYAFNNSNLKLIVLKDSDIIFKQQMDTHAFNGCSNLTSLDISYNNLNHLQDDFLEILFKDIKGLTYLAMGACHLYAIPMVVTNLLHNLQFLYVYLNPIQQLPKELFKNLTKLTHFIAYVNQITTLEEETFPDKVKQQLQILNLGKNPFACTCDMQWFLKWTIREQYKFKDFPEYYRCESPEEYRNLGFTEISVSNQMCLFQTTVYLIIIGVTTPILTVAIICFLLYRWRWHIRYFLYLCKYQGFPNRIANRQCIYDAFVVYSTMETNWIIHNLIPNLEERAGLALCVHERDFDVGGAIVDNIVESIDASKKVLIIVSSKTLQSEWCQFEINFAHRRSLHAAPGSLVIVLKEDIASRYMSSNIRALLELQTYIIWPADDNDLEARNLFWDRLETEIKR